MEFFIKLIINKLKSLLFKYEKCMFKTNGKLLFGLLIINKLYTPKIFLLRILHKLP